MKKTISLILVLCLIIGILTSCNLKRISIEEDIIYMQIGGYLYTSMTGADTRSERICLNERKDAVKDFLKTMEKTAKDAFTLTSALNNYEDCIIKYIDKAEPQTDESRMTLRDIAERIIVYKVKIDALESEISFYQKMKLRNPALSAAFAAYENDTICTLFLLQDEYLMFLSEGVDSLFLTLMDTSERQAGRFTDSADSILNKKIEPAREDLIASIEKAALMHSYIASGDYMLAQYNLEKATNNIAMVKLANPSSADNSEIADLEKYIESLRTSSEEPPVMKPVPEDSSEGHLSFTRSVSAMDPQAWILVDATLPLYEMVSIIYKDKSVDLPPTNQTGNVTESKPAEIGAPSTLSSVVLSEDAGYMVKISEDSARKRADAISKINLGQSAISFLGFMSTTDDKYNMILNQVTGLIANGKNSMSEEKRLKAVTLIKDNINELIGENREAFVNRLTSESAEKIYDTFIEWKSKIKNLEDHDFTLDDMKVLLTRFGIEVKEPVVQPPTDSSSVSQQPTNIVSGKLPTADDYTYPQILLKYESLLEIDQNAENETILSTILGWTDPLDYSAFEKKKIYDDSGSLTKEYYYYISDSNKETPIGWDIQYNENQTYYVYRFPEGVDRSLSVFRYTADDTDLFAGFSLSYNDLKRSISLSFTTPDDAHYEKYKLKHISEGTNGVKDGLQSNWNSAWDTYSVWAEGKELYNHYYKGGYKDGYLFVSRQFEYDGDDVYANILQYLENGALMSEFNLLNNKNHGICTTYYENGVLKLQYSYIEGLKDGTCNDYFENGQFWKTAEYKENQKHGDYISYYNNDSHQVHYSVSYVYGEKDGIWVDYEEDGSIDEEIEYKDGVKDGKYTNPGNRYGQYRDGKEHGM
ncbi:MAG: toxin-antitoxin system YwqK family antitoxin, partial [Clostridiales bacterium]|nr:toxin-antitoxin system YwqK family antitoxin [Clostridiales bacterium]